MLGKAIGVSMIESMIAFRAMLEMVREDGLSPADIEGIIEMLNSEIALKEVEIMIV